MSNNGSIAGQAPAAVSFVQNFVASEAFKALFREGMSLVETTASYLDGAGREESKALGREASLAYATESMRLTTRLMQIASWLLVHRAVAEKEITPDQARNEKNRVRLSDAGATCAPELAAELPAGLTQLVAHSLRLMERIHHLETQFTAQAAPAENPVAQAMGRLSAAFARA